MKHLNILPENCFWSNTFLFQHFLSTFCHSLSHLLWRGLWVHSYLQLWYRLSFEMDWFILVSSNMKSLKLVHSQCLNKNVYCMIWYDYTALSKLHWKRFLSYHFQIWCCLYRMLHLGEAHWITEIPRNVQFFLVRLLIS